MKTWQINYSLTVNNEEYSGTMEVKDRTMNPKMAREYAARDLMELSSVTAFDVNNIEVEYREVDD